MPPALSDEEVASSSGDEQVPAQKPGSKGKAEADPVEEEEDDEEQEEDEYVVEKIMSHKVSKGTIIYDVKWQGYDDPVDRTWEPESNLDGAQDVLNEYFEEIGGRPEPGKKRKGRKSTAAESERETPVTAKRLKKEKEWTPPPGSWEHQVSHVDTVEEAIDPATGKKTRYAYIVWVNQKKTQHPLSHIYQKCPQRMLEYYENHLVFSLNDNPMNGDGDGDNVMEDEGVY